MTLKLHI